MGRPNPGRLVRKNPDDDAKRQTRTVEPRDQYRYHGLYAQLQRVPGRRRRTTPRHSDPQTDSDQRDETGSEGIDHNWAERRPFGGLALLWPRVRHDLFN